MVSTPVAPQAAAPAALRSNAAAATAIDEHSYPIEFTATAAEYFRVWIVNLLLTILTLGVYSAWAKVRKKRYLYGHTRLDGDPFEYRGNPIAILKGRIIAVAVVAIVYSVNHFAPTYLWAVLLAAVPLVPWLLVRSFAFNAHNSAYRNVRFAFRGGYWACLGIFLGYGLLTVVTVGLGYFYLKTRLTEFIVRNHSFGVTPFEVPKLKKAFFSVYGKMIGLGLLSGIVIVLLSFGIVLVTQAPPRPGSPVAVGLNVLSYVLYLGIFAYVRANIINATWNQTELGSLRFRSTLRALPLYGIYLTNVAAILATLGLATPWAVVRTLRYRACNFCVVTSDGLDHLAAVASSNVGAAGEEVGEMLDFDFSL